MHHFKLIVYGLAVAAAFSQIALARQQSEAQGSVQDSSFNLLNRAFYFNRDFHNSGSKDACTDANKPGQENGYSEEAAYWIIYRANLVQYSDFNAPGDESWQLRYDLDMASYGVPEL